MNKRLLFVGLLVFVAATPARAGFDEVVRAVESSTHLHPTRLPFLGVARFAVWCSHPSGVHDFQLATFEDHGDGVGAGSDLGAILERSAGNGFRPLVRAWSRHGLEWTYILARPSGENVELMIATRDKTDTVVMRVVLDADRMVAQIEEPKRESKLAR